MNSAWPSFRTTRDAASLLDGELGRAAAGHRQCHRVDQGACEATGGGVGCRRRLKWCSRWCSGDFRWCSLKPSLSRKGLFSRAGEGIRTLDVHLGKGTRGVSGRYRPLDFSRTPTRGVTRAFHSLRPSGEESGEDLVTGGEGQTLLAWSSPSRSWSSCPVNLRDLVDRRDQRRKLVVADRVSSVDDVPILRRMPAAPSDAGVQQTQTLPSDEAQCRRSKRDPPL
jgi:hypothetical protein